VKTVYIVELNAIAAASCAIYTIIMHHAGRFLARRRSGCSARARQNNEARPARDNLIHNPKKGRSNANPQTKLRDDQRKMKSTMGYDAIPSTDSIDTPQENETQGHWGQKLIAVAVAVTLIAIGWAFGRLDGAGSSKFSGGSGLPVPYGVNLASWLSLEDYFFVGTGGAVEVATPDDTTAAKCLPPLSNGLPWHSETDLFANLTLSKSTEKAIRAFHAFRVTYLDWEEELPQIAALGIKRVRVPISWCLTDHDPSSEDLSDLSDEELLERFTCQDPFFNIEGIDVTWPAVPRSFLVDFLRACGRHGIKATLDVHTYPGGTSLGTFSGVWPRKPLFWKYDSPGDSKDVGRTLFHDFLAWIESLDETALAGVGAITPMNEPAHLAGLFGPGSPNPDKTSFLPSLTETTARDFLSGLSGVPDGPHLRVLLWQSDAVAAFRSTSLPSRGIELHVNVHESILVPSLVPDDGNDPGGRHPAATVILAAWWRGVTIAEERRTWAVLDMHHYHAWEPVCQGTVDGLGAYTCGDPEATDTVLGQCASWASIYRQIFDEQLQDRAGTAKLVSGEFSASTHHSVLRSCTDTTTLRKSYLAQIEAAEKANVGLFWWSWKMPHGDAFRPAWSFKQLLWRLGVEGFTGPDESEIGCG
jgi:hypothetical protein